MKILIYVAAKFLYTAGGAEKVCCNLANEMVRRGHHVSVICHDILSDAPFYSFDSSIEIYGLGQPEGNGMWNIAKAKVTRLIYQLLHCVSDAREQKEIHPFYLKAREIIDDKNPDIVLCLYYKSLYVLARYGKSDVPHLLSHHSNSENLKYRINRQKRNMLDHCDAIHLLMPSTKNAIEPMTNAEITAIPNPIEQISTKYFVDHFQKKHTYQIVTLSRLHRDKQIELLIEAFSLLADNYPQWNLICYGDDGPLKYKKMLVQMIRSKKLENRVFLPGRTTSPMDILSKADIFAFPSKREGFGLAICEAMSVKLPCVGLKTTTGVNELITDDVNGLLADSNPRDFACKIKRLMDSPTLRTDMGDAGLRSLRRFTPKEIFDQWENLLKKTVENYKKPVLKYDSLRGETKTASKKSA